MTPDEYNALPAYYKEGHHRPLRKRTWAYVAFTPTVTVILIKAIQWATSG